MDTRLVVQVGRQFQERHPEIPVLVDRGRYLVVQVPPDFRPDPDPAAFGVFPAPADGVLLHRAAPARRAPDPTVLALVDRVDPAALTADIRQLAAYPTRHSTSTHFADAAAWAGDRLAGLGLAADVVPFTWRGLRSANVVGTGTGTGPVTYVTAHLDSVNHRDGAAGRAPGADDNASGSAGLLEIARVLRDRDDLRFVLFGGEEQGLYGSAAYVAGLPAAERDRVAAVVNLDMIGVRNTSEPTVLLEGAARWPEPVDGLAAAAATYTGLAVQISWTPFASDHVSFLDAGLPAVLAIEGADGANPAVHTAGDTPDRVDASLAADIVRMVVAYVAGRSFLGSLATTAS